MGPQRSLTSRPMNALTTAEQIGANLRAARDRRQLTQREVAEAVGAESRDVSRWENGRVEPGRLYRDRLAAVLFDGDLSAMYAVELPGMPS